MSCLLQFGHEDWVFDLKWLDDQIVVSGELQKQFCMSGSVTSAYFDSYLKLYDDLIWL